MSVMNGNDWSGPITVNSLPVEVRRRMAGMAMLVESARTAPNESRMIMGERYHGSPSGFPAVAETLAGGATKVTVNSLAVQRASQLIGSDADLQDKYSSLPLNQANRLRFQETFWDTVTRQRITEG